jgi:hypothetical protein
MPRQDWANASARFTPIVGETEQGTGVIHARKK